MKKLKLFLVGLSLITCSGFSFAIEKYPEKEVKKEELIIPKIKNKNEENLDEFKLDSQNIKKVEKTLKELKKLKSFVDTSADFFSKKLSEYYKTQNLELNKENLKNNFINEMLRNNDIRFKLINLKKNEMKDVKIPFNKVKGLNSLICSVLKDANEKYRIIGYQLVNNLNINNKIKKEDEKTKNLAEQKIIKELKYKIMEILYQKKPKIKIKKIIEIANQFEKKITSKNLLNEIIFKKNSKYKNGQFYNIPLFEVEIKDKNNLKIGLIKIIFLLNEKCDVDKVDIDHISKNLQYIYISK